jgi:hypothetical protein
MARSEDAREGVVECKELDWTVTPARWKWDDGLTIANRLDPVDNLPKTEGIRTNTESRLIPPFDLIITADTLYISELVTPLLRTLHTLAQLSILSRNTRSSITHKIHSCPVYVCVERRDPALMDRAFEECKSQWGFTVERVRSAKIRKALERAGLDWTAEKNKWDGIEIWKMRLPVQADGFTADSAPLQPLHCRSAPCIEQSAASAEENERECDHGVGRDYGSQGG